MAEKSGLNPGVYAVIGVVLGLLVGAAVMYAVSPPSGTSEGGRKLTFLVYYAHWEFKTVEGEPGTYTNTVADSGAVQTTLKVKKGDTVTIVLARDKTPAHDQVEEAVLQYYGKNMTWWEEQEDTNPSVKAHTLDISEFNIHLKVDSDQWTAMVTFTADKTGTFTGTCGNYCGPGHQDMKLTLVVS